MNAVCPGAIDTPMLEADIELAPDPAAARQAYIDEIPLTGPPRRSPG